MKTRFEKTGVLVLLVLTACSKLPTGADSAAATETDGRLATVIANNALAPLPNPPAESASVVLLGEALFADPVLSGNRDTSCLSCHNLSRGTVDGLPFSVGTGTTATGSARRQVNGVSLPTTRNAPALYNLGRANQLRAFLDGRVGFINQIVSSDVPQISGASPARSDIKTVFRNVYDIQPLFPLLSEIEMLGTGNDLSAHTTDIDVWQAILSDRLLGDSAYVTLFTNAFPAVATANLNAGHIGRAIGAFMKVRLKSNNAPFDRYLRGELDALTEGQKRGMLLFYTKGQCVRCHRGPDFTDDNFHSSGAPQIGFAPFADDTGRAAITGLNADLYKFKTPSLRNISLTAPYMHNGSLETLEAVVSHYNDVTASLANYRIPASYQSHYDMTIVYDNNAARNQSRVNQIDVGRVRQGLGLTNGERTDLVDFLRNALRDPGFQ